MSLAFVIRRLGLAAILLCLLLSARAGTPDETGLVVLHDVVIGKGGAQDLHAEIAYPKNATGPQAAIISIHGGGWVSGSYKGDSAVNLARAGYFAASIEYRLDNVAKWPAQLDDCKLAVRWLRANAAKYNVDPNHIGVFGESAGGHLVACLGTMPTPDDDKNNQAYPGVSSAVQAVVDFYGPTKFTPPMHYSPYANQLIEGLFGVPYDKNPELWRSGSPVFHVAAGDPPMLLVHGDADELVPIEQSVVFDQALTKAGVPHQFLVVKNGIHGLAPKPGTSLDPGWPGIIQTSMGFFDKYLKTRAPGTTLADEGDFGFVQDVVVGQGGGHDLHADLAWPKKLPEPLPAVISVHGGGWGAGTYKGHIGLNLAHAGFFAASIEYRLDGEAKWPAQLDDCKQAVRWLRANAAKYNIDPNRIAVFGDSAGGHLVACLGTMATPEEDKTNAAYPGVSSAVQAVVEFYGPTDFRDPSHFSPTANKIIEDLFGTTFAKNPDLWKSGSPITHVASNDPPMLLVHGELDDLVPVEQATLFDAALTKAGVPHQLVVVKNAGHGFVPKPGTTDDPPMAVVIKDVVDFLNKYLPAPALPKPATP